MARIGRALAAIGCVAALTAVCACEASEVLGPEAPQGIEGVALLGPLCPVASEADPCPDRPYQATLEVRTYAESLVTSVRTGEDGRFRVGLQPGRYRLVPEKGNLFPAASDQDVEVREGVYAQVTVAFDTGIR